MDKLRRIRSPRHRLYISLFVSWLLFLNIFLSPRARVHWVGSHRRRRLERPLIILLFLVAMLILQPREFAWWATMIGGATSIYLTLYSVALVIPRKQYHWVS